MTVPYVKLIHSVDSPKLFNDIRFWCNRNGYSVDVLLELHIASEESKQGFSEEEVMDFLRGMEEAPAPVHIRGVMGMASLTDDESVIRREFEHLNSIFSRIAAMELPYLDRFDIKSFGMTNDYRIAVEMGSDMVRIGTRIFGPRGVRI